jgi:hypothetical protein
MSHRCRYEQALADKNYQAIADYAGERLEAIGHFSKEDVLDNTGYGLFSETINWDFVRRMLEEKFNTRLIALAPCFFKRHKKDEELNNPARFLAGGTGRRAAGYAHLSTENGHFVIVALHRQRGIINGLTKSAKDIIQKGQVAGIEGLMLPEEKPLALQ